MSVRRYSRSELADALAIDRLAYEADVASQGYSQAALQPLAPFCHDTVKRMVIGGAKIRGCSVTRSIYGDTVTLNVDWKALARVVERRLPRWREVESRVAA